MTIQELDARVRVTHLRRSYRDGLVGEFILPARVLRANGIQLAPTGGETHVRIEMPDGRTFEGSARCSPRDNFCRRRGREIAIGRALKAGPISALDEVLAVANELGVDLRARAFLSKVAAVVKAAHTSGLSALILAQDASAVSLPSRPWRPHSAAVSVEDEIPC